MRQGQAVWGATALHQRRVDWGAAATRGLNMITVFRYLIFSKPAVRSLAVVSRSGVINRMKNNGLNNEPNCRLDRLSVRTACASF